VAVDFQVVVPQEVVLLNKVRLVPGPPRALDVLGDDFRSVDEVLINGQVSPDVVVLGQTRLLAQLPDTLGSDRITSVSVLSKRLVVTSRSLLRTRVGRTPGRVSGITRLVQVFVKVLFTTPGTDIFSPNLGGGALRGIGHTYGVDEGADLVQDFVIAVDQTARQLVASQSRNPRLPRDERLLSAKVLSSSFNPEASGLDVSVEITSQGGRTALTNIGI